MKYIVIASLLCVNAIMAMNIDDSSLEILAPHSPGESVWTYNFWELCQQSPTHPFYNWKENSEDEKLVSVTPEPIETFPIPSPTPIPAALAPIAVAMQMHGSTEDDDSIQILDHTPLPDSDSDYTPSSTVKIKKTERKKRVASTSNPRLNHQGTFPCTLCPQTFTWSWGLAEHLKHSCPNNKETYNVRKFPCTIKGCNHRAKRKSDLNRHKLLPHPLRKVQGKNRVTGAKQRATQQLPFQSWQPK